MSDAIAQKKDSLDQGNLLERVRVLARKLLEDKAAPEAISFALAYIATELGLAVANNPVDVFPVVLSAVSQASAENSTGDEEETRVPLSESPPPINTTIH
jgi:hypothetical protein